MKRVPPIWLWLVPAVLLALGTTVGRYDASPASGTGSGIDALATMDATVDTEYVGSDTCAACHDDIESSLSFTAHGSAAFEQRSEFGCETCHGPGSAHVDDPENHEVRLGLADWTAQAVTDSCLTCHGDDQPRFRSNAHAKIGMACTSCHSIHQASGWTLVEDDDGPFQTARVTGASAQCIECHGDVGAEFEFNERHRLQENILGCASCHDPHGPSARSHLGGFKQEACVTCHADKGGPFVFEHGSVRAEGCTSCHTPHGSPNRHMLTQQNVAEVCYSCHVEVPGFHIGGGRFSLDTQCTNCHSSIHGSNFSPVFFK